MNRPGAINGLAPGEDVTEGTCSGVANGARLLSSIEDFLDSAISEEDSDEDGSPWNKTLSLVPPTVTTLSSIPLPSTRTTAAAAKGGNNSSAAALPSCPMIPPGLRGPIKVTLPAEVPPSMEEVESRFPNLLPGGRSRPRDQIQKKTFLSSPTESNSCGERCCSVALRYVRDAG